MTRPPIAKRAEDAARCNMPSYADAVAGFSWEAARKLLDGLPVGGLNIAYEAIDRHVAHGRGDVRALRWLSADGRVVDYTYDDLRRQTNRFANVLRRIGVAIGERVYSLLGRTPELHIAALGALKTGAVFCPMFSAFGPEPIRSRMERFRLESSRSSA